MKSSLHNKTGSQALSDTKFLKQREGTVIKVVLADDHLLFREGIKRLLSDTSGIVVVDEARDGRDLLNKLKQCDCNVVLLDISMPGRSGLDVLKQLKNEKPGLEVLVLSMHAEEEYAERMLKAGAAGYLVKQCSPDELIEAIYTVAKGKKYITSSFAEIMASNLGKESTKMPHEILSDREYEVMCMIASGKSIKEIAEELSLSNKTISAHRTHILEKLRIRNNLQLIHYAMQNKLID
jgi:DNA-binding NarL/FixJ family response regulator